LSSDSSDAHLAPDRSRWSATCKAQWTSEYIDKPEDEALVSGPLRGGRCLRAALDALVDTPLPYRMVLLGANPELRRSRSDSVAALRSPGSLPAGVPLRHSSSAGSSPRHEAAVLRARDWSSTRPGQRTSSALERVDDADRAAFVLREVERLSPEEVAVVLCTSPRRSGRGRTGSTCS